MQVLRKPSDIYRRWRESLEQSRQKFLLLQKLFSDLDPFRRIVKLHSSEENKKETIKS